MPVASEAAKAIADNLGTTALAIGALGTAAFGIVDGLKLVPWIDLAGFERLFSGGGASRGRMWPAKFKAGLDALLPALKLAYGTDVMELLKAQYRSGRANGDLPRTLRQGVRIGFGMMPEKEIVLAAVGIGLPGDAATEAAAALVQARQLRPPAAGESPPPAPAPSMDETQRAALARLETAIDARIDAALMLADTLYIAQTKVLATLVAVGIALWVGWMLDQSPVVAVIVGIVAVPLAPVAKDLATALGAAVTALRKQTAR